MLGRINIIIANIASDNSYFIILNLPDDIHLCITMIARNRNTITGDIRSVIEARERKINHFDVSLLI